MWRSIGRLRRQCSRPINFGGRRIGASRRAIAHGFVVFGGTEERCAVFKAEIQRLVRVGAIAVGAAFHRNQFTLVYAEGFSSAAAQNGRRHYTRCALAFGVLWCHATSSEANNLTNLTVRKGTLSPLKLGYFYPLTSLSTLIRGVVLLQVVCAAT